MGPRGRAAAALAFLSILLWASAFSAAVPHAAFAASLYPEATGNINDFAGVLSGPDKVDLDALADAVLSQTGTTFAVAILDTLGDQDLLGYTVGLYEEWGIGEKGEDKGLLVVLSLEERALRMEVGYGLEHIITDARAGDCLDIMTPYFAGGDYGKGLYAGLLRAAQYVGQAEGVSVEIDGSPIGYQDDLGTAGTPFPWFLLPVLLGPLGLILFFTMRGKRCPKCKAKLTVTDRVIQKATYDVGGLATRVYHCGKCGYHDERPYKTSKLKKPPTGGFASGGGPFFGGGASGRRSSGGGISGPRGFGGGRSGGGGAGRKW